MGFESNLNGFSFNRSQTFGDAASDRRAAAKRAAAKKTPTKKTAAAKPRKMTITKSYGLPKNTGKNSVTFKTNTSDGRGTAAGGFSSNPLSIYNAPAPPNLTVVKASGTSLKSGLLSLASQWIAGNARNQTTQLSDGVPVYSAQQIQAQQAQYDQNNYDPNYQPEQNPQNNRNNGAGANFAESLGSGFDGILSWAAANPLTVALIGGGAFLLFRDPPKYGNRR